jgi:hypothetical protein
MTAIFNTLKAEFAKSEADAREFLVSRVNVGDLQMLQGFAELEQADELAFLIWDVRA